jgi:hypothetical protein
MAARRRRLRSLRSPGLPARMRARPCRASGTPPRLRGAPPPPQLQLSRRQPQIAGDGLGCLQPGGIRPTLRSLGVHALRKMLAVKAGCSDHGIQFRLPADRTWQYCLI